MSEERVGSTFGKTATMDTRPKVGDEAVGVAVEEMDAREGAKRIEKSRQEFYSKIGMKAPKEGEPDAQIDAGDYLPGTIPVKVPKNGERTEKPKKPEARERRAQPPLRTEQPKPLEEVEEPAEEEAAEEAPAEDVEEETTDEGVSPESEESGDESADEESSSDLDEEATVLKRAQLPMSVVKKLNREESTRVTGIFQRLQSTIDDLGRQLGEAKANRESESNSEPESESVTPTEQPGKRASVEPLLGLLGEDAAPALAEYDKSIDARVKAAEQRLSSMYVDDLLDDAREGLKDRFPELLNDSFFKNTIRPEMALLGQSKLTKLSGATKRAKFQSLMEKAAQNAREAKGLKDDRRDKAPAAPARKHGTVSPPKRSVTPPKIGTKDRAEASWEMLMQGIAPKEVKRRLDSRT